MEPLKNLSEIPKGGKYWEYILKLEDVMFKKISMILFIASILCFIIYCKNFIDLGGFVDENNISPDIVLGGNVYMYMDWIGLLISAILVALTFINIFNAPPKFSKTINIFVVIFSSIFCFISSVLVLNALTYLSEVNMPIYSINGGIMGFIISLMVIIFALATALISLWKLFSKKYS